MFKSVILALIWFLAFIATHVFVFHKLPPQRRFRAIVCIMLLMVIGYAVSFCLISRKFPGDLLVGVFSYRCADILVGLFFYAFFLIFYYQVLIIIDRSVSVRIMVDIDKAADKGMTLEELKSSYSIEEKFRDEVRDMLFMSRFREEGAYLYNTSKGSFHARVVGFLRKYLNLATNR